MQIELPNKPLAEVRNNKLFRETIYRINIM